MASALEYPDLRSDDTAAMGLNPALGILIARVVAETHMPVVCCIDSWAQVLEMRTAMGPGA
jgi:hypothetical protein